MGTVENPADNRLAKALQQWSNRSSWLTALANERLSVRKDAA
jgi:hypothetical protein